MVSGWQRTRGIYLDLGGGLALPTAPFDQVRIQYLLQFKTASTTATQPSRFPRGSTYPGHDMV